MSSLPGGRVPADARTLGERRGTVKAIRALTGSARTGDAAASREAPRHEPHAEDEEEAQHGAIEDARLEPVLHAEAEGEPAERHERQDGGETHVGRRQE